MSDLRPQYRDAADRGLGAPTTLVARLRRTGLLLVAVLLTSLLGAPRADAQDDSAQAIRAKIVAASKQGEWKGILNKLASRPDAERPALYAAVLEPFLSGSEPDVEPSKLRALQAFLAQYLLEETAAADIEGLEAPLVRMLGTRTVDLAAVREALTVDPDSGRAEGWDRLLRMAGRVLTSVVKDWEPCLRILSAEQGGTRAVDVLAFVVTYRITGEGKNLKQPPAEAYLAFYNRFLGHRFTDVKAADAWITAHVLDDLATWTDWDAWTQEQRDGVEARVRRAIKQHHLTQPVIHADQLKRVLSLLEYAITKIGPDESEKLAQFWTEEASKLSWMRPIQLAAIRHAQSLKLKPDAKGVAALQGLFEFSKDPEVLEIAKGIVNGWAVREPTEDTKKLAVEMLRRLSRGNGDHANEDRILLMKFVSNLGGARHLESALNAARKEAIGAVNLGAQDSAKHVAFYVECIKSMAGVQGGEVRDLTSHYVKDGRLGLVEARVAVVEGLSRRRIRENAEQRVLAAQFVGQVLLGGSAVQEETEPEVRLAAIRTLADFDDKESAEVLRRLAVPVGDTQGGTEEEQAIQALARHLRVYKSEHAGPALAAALAHYAQTPAMERYVIAQLAAPGDPIAVPSQELCTSLRGLLGADPARPAEVREEVLQALTLLGDGNALDYVHGQWLAARTARDELPADADDARKAAADAAIARWKKHFNELAVAAARRNDPAQDAAVTKMLTKVRDGPEGVDWVLSLLESQSLGDDAKRPAYRLQGAYARRARAADASRAVEARTADVDAALATMGEIVDALPDDQKAEAIRLRYELHFLRATLDTDTAKRVDFLEAALTVAAGNTDDKELVRKALAEVLPVLQPLLDERPQEQQKRIAQLTQQLQDAAGS